MQSYEMLQPVMAGPEILKTNFVKVTSDTVLNRSKRRVVASL
jgi:hypothetical protein